VLDAPDFLRQIYAPMYAVMKTGGKQYKVAPGDIVQIEKITGEKGDSVDFSEVLLVAKNAADSTQIWLGKPLLSGAAVKAEIVGQGRGDKLIIFKMSRRAQYRKTQGHRQDYTQVLVTAVANGAGETTTLGATERKEVLTKFQSHLTPRGLAAKVAPTKASKRAAALGTKEAPAKSARAAKSAAAKSAVAKKKTTTKKSAE
jgi:large subunit ribosomal protein L21